MVLNPVVTRPAATAAIAPETESRRGARHATDVNRNKSLNAELSFPPAFLDLSAGANKMPGPPFHDPRLSLPSHIVDIPPAADSGATKPCCAVNRCFSCKAAKRSITAVGHARIKTVIRAFSSPVRFVQFRFKTELRRLSGDLPVHSTKRQFFAAIAVLASTGSAFAGRQRAICVPVHAPVLTALFTSSPFG